jgi:hypothetical protein
VDIRRGEVKKALKTKSNMFPIKIKCLPALGKKRQENHEFKAT